MGGCDFMFKVNGNDLNKAFSEAVDQAAWELEAQAAWEHGHGGYSGTIAEKPSVELRKKEPMLMGDAEVFAEEDIENNDKWGSAFAIPLCASLEDKTIIGFLLYGIVSS
jgi:hypothetical protein